MNIYGKEYKSNIQQAYSYYFYIISTLRIKRLSFTRRILAGRKRFKVRILLLPLILYLDGEIGKRSRFKICRSERNLGVRFPFEVQ